MRKARITVPAVCTNLGPGIASTGLALGMALNVTMMERGDSRLLIETSGENSADLSPDGYHPVMRAATRVFQAVEDSPIGLHIDVRNRIPYDVGLGAEAAMTVAGLVGANSLMGTPLPREALIEIGADLLGRADGIVAAMFGGLTVTGRGKTSYQYRNWEIPPYKVLVIVPEIEDYRVDDGYLSESVSMQDAITNIGRQALLVEALRENDMDLLQEVIDDNLLEQQLAHQVPGYRAAKEIALDSGALGVTLLDHGPAIMIFTLVNHYRIADDVQSVFDAQDVLSKVWTLTVDNQGVVVTATETLSDE